MATAPWCDCLEVSVHLGDEARSISEGEGGLHGVPSFLHVADPWVLGGMLVNPRVRISWQCPGRSTHPEKVWFQTSHHHPIKRG